MDKILVADLPSMDARYSAAFTGWPLVFVRSMEEASAALEAPHYDAIAIGVYFDDSQMFDLVRAIRSHEVHNEVPVLCVRGAGQNELPVACIRCQRFVSPALSIEGLELAAQAAACNLFLDLTKYPDDAAGNAEARKRLETLFTS